ncbi:glycosyltransferase family 39 protein [Patescibacteria group bacterium]|nr:glycosyltransferase family 39 protein [Patescibacteria group bacterium]
MLIRIPSLGRDNFNTDVWRWKSRSYDFGSAISNRQFDQTLQKYHPGVTLMWLGSAGAKINNYWAIYQGQSLVADDDIGIVFQLDFIQKLLVVIVLGLTTSLIFYVLKNIINLKFAFLSVLLLTLEPFYLGLTRVFHLEGLVSTFILASILWSYYFLLNTSNKKRLAVSGFFAGLAFLTKTSALFLIPFYGLSLLTHIFRNGKYFSNRKNNFKAPFKILINILKDFSILFFPWLLVSVITFSALWPAMWVIPVRAIQTLYDGITSVGVEGDHFQFYFGNLVENPGPTFYFVVLGFKSSIYLLAGFIGSLFIRKKLSEDYRKLFDYLLVFIFFYFIQLTIPSKKLDRYILPVLVVMSLGSSMFFTWLIEKIKFKRSYYKMITVFLFLIPAIYTNFYIHSDYFSYFNPLFGGLRRGVEVLEPKWLIGTGEITEYFEKMREDKEYNFSSGVSYEKLVYMSYGRNLRDVLNVGFKEKYYTQIWPFFKEFGAWAVILDLGPYAARTKYFVYPIWDDDHETKTELKMSYFDTIYLRGVPLYTVYKNEGPDVYAR